MINSSEHASMGQVRAGNRPPVTRLRAGVTNVMASYS